MASGHVDAKNLLCYWTLMELGVHNLPWRENPGYPFRPSVIPLAVVTKSIAQD